jgi:hypothetical protein
MGHNPAGHGVDLLMKWFRSPFTWFLLAIVVTAGLVAVGPVEASLACFAMAGLAGLVGILLRGEKLHAWSTALGQTGIVFWIIYLPLSLWAMQSNWNGLFLGEPRFRVAFILAVTGTLLQVGLLILGRPVITSLVNVSFFAALWILLHQAGYVLHPEPSPIFSSGNFGLQLYFIILVFTTLAGAWFLTRWWLQKTT